MEDKAKILVACKETTGNYAGQYRFFDKEKPSITVGYCHQCALTEMLDSFILSPPYGEHWDCCEILTGTTSRTVYFDEDYKKDMAKDLIAKLVAINTGTNLYVGEDVVEETESECENPEASQPIEEIIEDYLGLSKDYAWIFK